MNKKLDIIKCPMCRKDTKLNDSVMYCDEIEMKDHIEKVRLENKKIEEENEKLRIKKEEDEKRRIIDGDLTKIERLDKLLTELNEKDHKKILIFSQYTHIFSQVVKLLQKGNMKYARFDDGINIKKLNDIIDKYKNNDIDIMLLDTSMYAAGLNLEMSTDVIFLHNTDNYNQVIGRAQRPGRTCPLNVYHLRYENELL
jgi:SNF2 family DNA or RNA helicase